MINTALTPYLVDPSFSSTIPAAQQLNAQSFVPISPPQLPSISGLSDYYKKAFEQLQPYYSQKLAEAKGDLEEAKRRITYDYQTGMRYNTEDTSLAQERQTQDFQSAMDKLGLTFKNEGEKQADTLNQRGIGLVQGPGGSASAATGSAVTYDANGKPVYSGGQGQAGSEISMLKEDQRLRSEAETRSAQRNLQDIGIKGTRQATSLGEVQGRGTYDTSRQFQQTGEQLGEQQQSQAYGIASQKQALDDQRRAIAAQNAMYGSSVAGAGYSGSGGKTYDQMMAESGQQSTLDAQRRNGTYNAAAAAYGG